MSPRFDPRRLTPAQQEQRIAAANAKAAMSRDGLSLRRAAARFHVPGRAILRWFPGSFGRDARGRYMALPDSERFLMTAVTADGVLTLEVVSSEERSEIGRQLGAIGRLLDPDIGDPGPLMEMRGTVVAGHELETDPDVIEELWLAGELDFVPLYVLDA